ncbi:MAG: DUF4266 domain-containing protein [Chlorobiales bacterium]|jgi:hypothetical protein|nr:DUF4266 domain-containing protein [Chlorobiales bacterium]
MKKTYLILLLVISALSGCTTVQPWERGTLADPIMIFDENPIEKGIKEHHIDNREGSEGGTGAQSGGCGCG